MQELIARLTHTHISSSNSSVNATLDATDASFPLGQAVYADFSHDDIIVSVLTALSVDFFKPPPTLDNYPPNKDTHVTLSRMTPFGANLITEVIGCADENPQAEPDARVSYTPTQYGYDASKASNKFIRMRLNNAIVPLSSIRGGACGNATHGRVDGLCAMDDFLKSQEDAYKLSNYAYACFGNYTIGNNTKDVGYDGTIVKGKTYN